MARGTRGRGFALVCAAFVLGGCATPIAGGLSDDEANRVVVALERAGVDTTKEADPVTEGRYRVLVPREDAARAVGALREEELPPRPAPGVLDSLGKSSLVPSSAVEHAQYVAGLAGDLEKTFLGVDGVVSARVHVSIPPPDPLGDRPTTRSTASVLLKHRGSTPPIDGASVQRLVAGAVTGMKVDDVAVVLLPRPALTPQLQSQITHLGPIAVTRGSAMYLRGLVALAILLCVSLAAGMVAMWARARRFAEAAAGAGEGS